LYCWYRMPADPISAPDSAGYLGFAPIRPLGYPVFLQLLGGRGAILAQPFLYGCALAWLGLETLQITSSLLASTSVIFGATLIPDLITYHASLLTESLFMSESIAFVAALIGFVRNPSRHGAALAGTLAGLAALVRTTGFAFSLIVPIALRLCRHRVMA